MKAGFKLNFRQLSAVLLGNIILGVGIAIFKYSGMGNDPFSAMCLSLFEKFHVSYAVFLICLNCFFFIFQGWLGKSFIGFGTIVNWFLLGYVVQSSISILESNLPVLDNIFLKLSCVILGVVIASLGLSLYQTANAGVAPFDSLALIVHDRLKIPYFWGRIFFDAICALIAFLAGGLIGIGTLACAFGFGPVIDFFNKTISEKLLIGTSD